MNPGVLTAVVHRREPYAGPTLTPAARNVRAMVLYPAGVHQAPDAPRQGDLPARPARQQIATFQAIAPYKAVMKDEFVLSARFPSPLASTPYGSQLPFVERGNIRRPSSEAFGSTFEIDPPDRYALLR